jgi:hypothetical protein
MNAEGEQLLLVRRHGWAWVILTLALALHVADEALTDFLAFYNPLVNAIRARLPWFPMPTFTFDVWISGLVMAVVTLLALSVFAFRGARWMVWLSFPYGVLMTLNALAHMLGSMYYGRPLPGVYSAPGLLAASIWLLACASAALRRTQRPPSGGPIQRAG